MEGVPIRFPTAARRRSILTDRQILEDEYLDRDSGLMNDGYFREMLSLERKRSERSGNPILLMLLNVKYFSSRANRIDTLRRIVSAISVSTRQSDTKGWYDYNMFLGIVFTEFGEADVTEAKGILLNKVKNNLAKWLTPKQADSIEISFETYQAKRVDTASTSLPLNLKACNNGASTQCTPSSAARLASELIRQAWLVVLVDMLLIAGVHMLSIWLRHGEWVNILHKHPAALIITLLFSTATLYTLDLYNTHRNFLSREIVLRVAVAAFVGGGISSMIFYVGTEGAYGRWLGPIQMTLFLVVTLLWRVGYGLLFQVASPKTPTVILGAGRCGQAARHLLGSSFSPYDLKGYLDDDPGKHGVVLDGLEILGSLDRLGELADTMGIKTAVLAITNNRSRRLTRRVLGFRLQGLEVVEMPTIYERLVGRVPVQHIEDQWLLLSDGFNILSKEFVQKWKRILDFVVSGLLLIFTAPLMSLTALAIRLESPGPVFYEQDRVGKGDRVFKVHKFRSMRVDAEAHGVKWAQKMDPRVTRVGRWIRMFRIDELPQMYNVFKGDMSLVGPRPERPEFVRELETKIPYYAVRHTVAPGITGWAQVKYPYGASLEDALRKLEYDVYYIKNMSILLDFKIMLRTVGVVLLGEGAR
jgi:sugar transferase (PEP-CTERM system associated)